MLLLASALCRPAAADDFTVSVYGGIAPGPYYVNQTYSGGVSACVQTQYQGSPATNWSVVSGERQDGETWVSAAGASVSGMYCSYGMLSMTFATAGSYRFTVQAVVSVEGGTGTGSAQFSMQVLDNTTPPPPPPPPTGGGGGTPPTSSSSSSLPGTIRVHVFDADNNNAAITGKTLMLMNADGTVAIGSSATTDAMGNGDFQNVYPGNYQVQLQPGEEYGYGYGPGLLQPVTLGSAETVVVEWPLNRLQPTLKVDVIGLRDMAGNDLNTGAPVGGMMRPRIKVYATPYRFTLRKLWVWTYDPQGGRRVWLMQANESATQGATEQYYSPDHLVNTYVVSAGWYSSTDGHGVGSCTWPNGAHTVLAAAEFNNPFGDPIKVGTPPTDAADQGTAGGATLGVTLKNLTVEILGTSNGTVDWLRYDPDGNASLSRPTITYKVDCWRDTPRTVMIYLIPTQKQGSEPLQRQTGGAPGGVASIELCVGNGTHTATWDGSMSYGSEPDGAPWGTYAFDVYAYDSDMYDWTSARLPYTLGVPATVTRDGQQIPGHQAWIHENTDGSRDMRFGYQLASTTNTPPASVLMTCLDGELAERGALAGDAVINQYKAGADGQGYVVAPLTADDIEVPPWRVILTGVAGSGAECRRDRQNPRMLAVNGLAGEKGVFQLWVRIGTMYDLNAQMAPFYSYVQGNMAWLNKANPDAVYELLVEAMTTEKLIVNGEERPYAHIPDTSMGRAAKYHVTTAHALNAAVDGDLGECQHFESGSGGKTCPDKIALRPQVIAQSYPAPQKAYGLPNALLHELGHAAGLDADERTGNTVMLSPTDPNAFGYAGACVWGPLDTEGKPTAYTQAFIDKMRKHCRIKAQ